ncbi:MAG: cation transporter [Nitrosomonadales bacterium]|nr:cation transporter [Nitrosomonadales bacterium]
MADCCSGKSCELEALRERQSATLKTVLVINAVMFVVELSAGLLSGSVSLVADSLDMLGDALVYGFSLYVVARGAAMKARAALFKGVIMLGFGLFVLGQAIWRIIHPELPVFETIGLIGLLALTTNGYCFYLLWKHRSEDINMSSIWLCSRNDIIANVSVLFAAAGVWLTHSGWPDIAVGLALAALFLRSALHVLRESIRELRTAAD